MIGLGSDKNRLISTTGEGKLNWWRITERIAMAVMHYCFNNMFSIVNIVKVDSKRSLCRILGIAKKNSFVPANLFFRPPFWTKIQNCKTSNVKQFVSATVTHAFFLVIWCHVRKCAEIWWMFQIEEKIRAQSPDDLRGQELGRVASVHFLFSQLPEKSYHRNWKTI